MSKTLESQESLPATNSDLEAAFSGPALLANRFYITMGSHGVRIAFTEQSPNALQSFRTAVSLSVQDAIGLYKVLRDVLKEPEAAIEAMMAEHLPKKDD